MFAMTLRNPSNGDFKYCHYCMQLQTNPVAHFVFVQYEHQEELGPTLGSTALVSQSQ